MTAIKLDPGKLLGFKIIAGGESTMRLTSPKIGDKGAPSMGQDAALADRPSLGRQQS